MTPTLYLGTHHPGWLTRPGMPPLMVSHRRLSVRRRLPRAQVGWVLDSGGFTELTLHGAWQTTPAAYAAAVGRYADEVGRLEWAAPQDWMCEPFMLTRTRRTIADHQRLTIANYLTLRTLAPELPWIPVLQGWRLADYLACLEGYSRAGVDLTTLPLVGLGSVCRRQATQDIALIVRVLAAQGLRLHGFGVKTLGLARYADHLASADSLAWSLAARRSHPLAGCAHGTRGTGNCANCPRWAMRWHARVTHHLAHAPRQLRLDDPAPWPGGTR